VGILIIGIGTACPTTNLPQRNIALPPGDKTMTHAMMNTFDRFALSFFLVLAATPILAVAAAASIH
jgi:hypothetical protein